MAWRSGQYRVFTVTYVVFALLLIATGGKATYLAGAYPAVFAGAGIAADRWLRSRPRALTLYGALALSVLIAAPFGLPLLPERTAVSYGNAMSLDQARGQSGWPEVADAVARAMDQLSPAKRSRAVVYAHSYRHPRTRQTHLDLPPPPTLVNRVAGSTRPPDGGSPAASRTRSALAWTRRYADWSPNQAASRYSPNA